MEEYYSIKLPKILYLTLLVSKYTKKKGYYNTNDLATDAQTVARDIIRLRKDKNDYKSLEDTNFGGLRGNLSTMLTLRGYVHKGSRYTGYYGLGASDRLVNAVAKGDILLSRQNFIASTKSRELQQMLELEAELMNIREEQAHIKQFLERNPTIGLTRDYLNFPKEAVVRSSSNVYFLRVLLNRYVDRSKRVIEYNLLNYWSGTKFKNYNLHALFAVPGEGGSWSEMYAVDGAALNEHKPLFLYFDTVAQKCFDTKANTYKAVVLEKALHTFSTEHENVGMRLEYDWTHVRDAFTSATLSENPTRRVAEFSEFLSKFLDWKKEFSVLGKSVVDIDETSSGGPDVLLTYSGGTTQKLELEHTWQNYIAHKHHQNDAWSGAWLYAAEAWDFERIKKLFRPLLAEHSRRVPTVFLYANQTGERQVSIVDWQSDTYEVFEVS